MNEVTIRYTTKEELVQVLKAEVVEAVIGQLKEEFKKLNNTNHTLPSKYYKAKEIIEILATTDPTLRKMRLNGQIEYIEVNGGFRYLLPKVKHGG